MYFGYPILYTNNGASTIEPCYVSSDSSTTYDGSKDYIDIPGTVTWAKRRDDKDELKSKIRRVFSGHSYAPKGLMRDQDHEDFDWHYDKAYAVMSAIRKLQNETDKRAFDRVMRRKCNLRWEKQSVNKKLTVRHKGRSASRSWMTGRPRK